MSEMLWETAFVIGWLSVLGIRAYYTRLKKKNRPEISYRTSPYIIIAVLCILLAMLVVPRLAWTHQRRNILVKNPIKPAARNEIESGR